MTAETLSRPHADGPDASRRRTRLRLAQDPDAARSPDGPEPQGDVVCPHCQRSLAERGADFRRRARDRGLTVREAAVIQLIGQGRTNKEIVERLGVSPNTLKSYIRTAYRRLEVESRSQAVIWANGFDVDPDEHPG